MILSPLFYFSFFYFPFLLIFILFKKKFILRILISKNCQKDSKKNPKKMSKSNNIFLMNFCH